MGNTGRSSGPQQVIVQAASIGGFYSIFTFVKNVKWARVGPNGLGGVEYLHHIMFFVLLLTFNTTCRGSRALDLGLFSLFQH